ncbi:RAP domain-containing protein, putative [Babesia ovata]|uniref:RAP domain-containing protein, putative n=1 Tax=Babesia ovata TaxID=189622 RepID=A0A2H6K6F4_9APIC|nr:RAP domain-containing protein, putative [Babesia ovata]GBE58574.1 RAP domain-containing protein, putative [Babesia ovata]
MSLHLRRCLYRSNASLSFPGLSIGTGLCCHNGASIPLIRRATFAAVSDGSTAARGGTSKAGDDSRWMKKPDPPAESASTGNAKTNITDGKFYFDADVENLSPEQQQQKEELIRELTRKLSGPLADENGNLPTGDDRPIAIEVDGPSHFYANSTKYTAYTKLKHRLLTRMGYKVLHVPYFEWRRLRGAKEREEYMREKLKEEPTEWIDPDDEAFYNKRMEALRRQTDGVISALEAESKASPANDA